MANRDKGLNERVTFMTDKTQREWLNKQVAETGAPLGEVIRRAINLYRKTKEKP
jgi:hypothetical protein